MSNSYATDHNCISTRSPEAQDTIRFFVKTGEEVGDEVLVSLGFGGYLWSSSLSPSSVDEAVGLGFNSGGSGLDSGSRFFGMPLRAVRP